MIKIYLNIPISFNIIFLKKKNTKHKNVILYNNAYFIKFVFYDDKINYIKEVHSICTSADRRNISSINIIKKFLKTFESYFFIKIKFKGKGFRIKILKRMKLIKFYFGRSHLTFFKLKKIKLKKINKYKFILKSLNFSNLKNTCINITNIKPINIFTLRGLRLSKQIISKRKGKKGSYI